MPVGYGPLTHTEFPARIVGSRYKFRSRTVSSLVAEYLVGGFMR
jgi:hypothetical protein